MDFGWKIWIIYLLIGDSITAVLLWRQLPLGHLSFLLISISQLIAYVFFKAYFGNQAMLIAFHVTCLALYAFLKFSKKSEN